MLIMVFIFILLSGAFSICLLFILYEDYIKPCRLRVLYRNQHTPGRLLEERYPSPVVIEDLYNVHLDKVKITFLEDPDKNQYYNQF